MPQLFNNLLLNVIKYFLRAYDKSHNYRRSLSQLPHSSIRGKIDGSCVPGPRSGAPSLRPDHLANEQTKPRKRSAKRIPIAAARPLPGLKSPVRGYATALLCNARPVASGLALIRCKGKANPA